MICLLNAVGLTPGGNSTVHIYTQTIRRTTQITTTLEECGSCLVFASFTLAFALQLRKNTENLSQDKKKLCQSTVYTLPKHLHTHTHTHTHYKTHTYTHTHTLQNHIKPPQCKLKQTQYKIYPNKTVTI